ncbi:pyridoxal phosphate-dependent transferase [Catenaria anguillulae PL171]|uniref:Pyridoxal phosphate-dependent transferase n=1 Tax=Catenaria anguillulae PL171 TaxID=765915 RepID=A0A1Y2HIZ4_9FUNG|nr:pyridoxal phosphate-dependent transferase [Catenaria anguillulae PL171]
MSTTSTTAAAAAAARITPRPIQASAYPSLLTPHSLARQPSAIRALLPLAQLPGMISLAGGLPNPATFPIADLSITFTNGQQVSLGPDRTRAALQYGPTPGLPDLVNFLTKLQEHVHGPPAKGHQVGRGVMVGNGSQDLLAKALAMVLQPGDSLLVESPCYVGTLAILKPMVKALGIKLISVPTDAQGVIPGELDRIMSTLDASVKRPKFMYTVPTGGNPTGNTASLDRRVAVYGLLQKHDLMLLEDDPYYYLQFPNGGVTSPALANELTHAPSTVDADADARLGEQFRSTLLPSYLALDTDARVLRFESFSKVVSAGLRLGMVTGPQPLIDRIALDVQSTSLQPTGPSQAIFHALADSLWSHNPSRFLAHAARVASFYQSRRDALVRAIEAEGLVARGLVEVSVPQAGMFLWLKVPKVKDTGVVINKYARDAKVLLLPGLEFMPLGGDCQCTLSSRHGLAPTSTSTPTGNGPARRPWDCTRHARGSWRRDSHAPYIARVPDFATNGHDPRLTQRVELSRDIGNHLDRCLILDRAARAQ